MSIVHYMVYNFFFNVHRCSMKRWMMDVDDEDER